MTRTRFSQFFILIIIALLVAGCGAAATESAYPTETPTLASTPTLMPTPTLSASARLALQIDSSLQALVGQGKFTGSVLVAKDGQVLLSQGYGMADVELDVPNTPQTKFRLGSITKQFTAMAILLLQQQDKLNLQDAICQYITDCPRSWHPITIQQLLTHTSGIHDFSALPGFAEFKLHPATPLQIIEQFRNLPLDFTPGKTFSYSNSGYILLGYIIEKVSGQAYADYLQQAIFQPLQMANTGYDSNRMIIQDRAQGYATSPIANDNVPLTHATYIDMSVPYSAGGLYSTVGDLYLWDQALYSETLLPRSVRDEMFTAIAQTGSCYADCSTTGYGYGWFIGNQFNQPWVWHSGGIDGFSSEIDRYPAAQVTIILLSNNQDIYVHAIASTIARMIFLGD